MTTKMTPKSLLPAVKVFKSNRWMVKQKTLAVTGVLVLFGSATRSEAKFEIKKSDYDYTVRQSRAAHFLSQATMGYDIADAKALAVEIEKKGYIEACEAWMDDQFALSRGTPMATQANAMRNADGSGNGYNGVLQFLWYGFYAQAIQSDEQLRQRMAFALSQTYVVSTDIWSGLFRSARWLINAEYYDVLLDGAFGNHRSLLGDVTHNPLMGNYLSHANNGKGDPENGVFPDQNYAREVMQLFSCGVYSLWSNGSNEVVNGELVENYTEEDIFEMAEVFTGLSQRKNGALPAFFSVGDMNQAYMRLQMRMNDNFHDQSSKILLDGTVLPAGQSGADDITQTLDVLAAHRSTAPYQSTLLIKRLTTSNPSQGYVRRVSVAWRDSGGDFQKVLKAILLDDEARYAIKYSLTNTDDPEIGVFGADTNDALSGRLKEPILKTTQFYKFFGATTDEADGHIRVNKDAMAFGMQFLNAPTVFNYYAAEYAPGDGPIGNFRDSSGVNFVAPEMEIFSDHVIGEQETLFDIFAQPNLFLSAWQGTTTLSTHEFYRNKKKFYVADYVDLLDLYLCHGTIPSDVNRKIKEVQWGSNIPADDKLTEAVKFIFNSADFAVTY